MKSKKSKKGNLIFKSKTWKPKKTLFVVFLIILYPYIHGTFLIFEGSDFLYPDDIVILALIIFSFTDNLWLFLYILQHLLIYLKIYENGIKFRSSGYFRCLWRRYIPFEQITGVRIKGVKSRGSSSSVDHLFLYTDKFNEYKIIKFDLTYIEEARDLIAERLNRVYREYPKL